MKKITKVLLGLLVGALAVGFASCKQVQDVNIVSEYSSGASYVCDATGTITANGTEYTVSSGIVEVSWSYNSTYDTDKTTYILTGILNAKAAGDTIFTHIHFDNVPSTTQPATEIYINKQYFTKLNGKFVVETIDSTTGERTYKDISDRFTNSPSDSTFSYTDTASGISLTFTRM